VTRPTVPLTLMAVHAHPDDEATSTGGALARYAAEGVRTVLVTCTNGELGDSSDGIKPEDVGHDRSEVAAVRLEELRRSCQALGVSDLELLDYRDSGMMGWPTNDEPGVFWQTPVPEAAARLGALIATYQPQVVLTYDANGFYGHPDHIQAHRITVAAVAAATNVAKLYFPTVPRSALATFRTRMVEAGLDLPDTGDDAEFGTDDALITTRLDCAAVIDQRRAALEAHASQADNIFFLRFPKEAFTDFFSVEYYVRAEDRTGAPIPEDDLFAGLR